MLNGFAGSDRKYNNSAVGDLPWLRLFCFGNQLISPMKLNRMCLSCFFSPPTMGFTNLCAINQMSPKLRDQFLGLCNDPEQSDESVSVFRSFSFICSVFLAKWGEAVMLQRRQHGQEGQRRGLCLHFHQVRVIR